MPEPTAPANVDVEAYDGEFSTALMERLNALIDAGPFEIHADAKTSTYPVKDDCGNDSRPAPEKERCDRSEMRSGEKNCVCPINRVSFRRCVFSVVLRFHSMNFLARPFA